MSEPDVSPQGLGISEEDWQQTPPSVRALVGVLHKRLAKVEEQLKLNSDTSSQPPSSDKPRHKPEQKGKLPSGKKRGAQPGHRSHRRKPLPPERVDEFRVYLPDACRHCGTALSRIRLSVMMRLSLLRIPPALFSPRLFSMVT
jgi:hypothetical protein